MDGKIRLPPKKFRVIDNACKAARLDSSARANHPVWFRTQIIILLLPPNVIKVWDLGSNPNIDLGSLVGSYPPRTSTDHYTKYTRHIHETGSHYPHIKQGTQLCTWAKNLRMHCSLALETPPLEKFQLLRTHENERNLHGTGTAIMILKYNIIWRETYKCRCKIHKRILIMVY